MNRIKKLVCLGGDDRSKYISARLNESGIYTDLTNEDIDFSDYDGIILPLPVSSDRKNIKGTQIDAESFCRNVDESKIIFAGKADERLKNILLSRGITFFDYIQRPEFSSKNSVPTAFGVLQYVMINSKITVNNLKIAVVGYGNCGRAVCRLFKNIGADVISASRKYITLAQAESDGIKSVLIKDLAKILPFADVIINTVPATILKKQAIDAISEEAMIIDISSYPYGFDYDYAEKCGKKVNLLPSLPGKYFPQSAGYIIADTITNIIEEEGL